MTTSSYLFLYSIDTSTSEIYTLSLHDALPISLRGREPVRIAPVRPPRLAPAQRRRSLCQRRGCRGRHRSEEHTSELQSHSDLVCRLLLEKKKKKDRTTNIL